MERPRRRFNVPRVGADYAPGAYEHHNQQGKRCRAHVDARPIGGRSAPARAVPPGSRNTFGGAGIPRRVSDGRGVPARGGTARDPGAGARRYQSGGDRSVRRAVRGDVESRVRRRVGLRVGDAARPRFRCCTRSIRPGCRCCAPAAWIIGKTPSYLTGERHPDRTVVAIADAWHTVAPALVFTVVGIGRPSWNDVSVLLVALAAQIATDTLAVAVREWLRLSEVPRLSLRLLGPVYLVDVCLTPIGFAVAFAAARHPVGATLALPLSALLMYFARDRRARMATALELGRAYRGTALLLGDVVEADDAYTGSHSRDVVELSVAVGPMLADGRGGPAPARVRRAAPRRRQDRDPQRDHQQARRADTRKSGRSSRRTRSRARRC